MSQEEIGKLLTKLKTELADLDASTSIHKEIDSVIIEIEQQLKTLEDKSKTTSLTENIRNHIEKFEAEHPRITNVLSDIMMKLMNIGV